MRMDQATFGILLQARMGSTRLPNKVLKPFYAEKTILDLILDRLKTANLPFPIFLATTQEPNDDILLATAQRYQVPVFRGETHDVAQRFIGAMQAFGLKGVLRICADNPFLCLDFVEEIAHAAQRHPEADYISHRIQGIPAIRTHYGLFCEFVSLAALKRSLALNAPLSDREHVTKFVYEHPPHFKLVWLDATERMASWHNLRLTIDTQEDFQIAQVLAQKTETNLNTLTWERMQETLKQNLDLLPLMSTQILRHQK